MKRLKRLLKLTLLFCLSVNCATAQLFPDVTPDNIEDVVDQIFEIHDGIIDQNYAAVYDFLDGLLPDSSNDPTYDPNCPPPDPTIDDANSTTVFSSWNAISGAYSYQASFLKLNQFPSSGPESGSIVTMNTNVQFTVSDGLILMAFKTNCTPLLSGRLDIIIVDKPVFFDHDLITQDCDCVNVGTTQFYEFADGIPIAFEYTQTDLVGYYSGIIAYDGPGGEFSELFIKVDFREEDKILIGKKDDCMLNCNNIFGENILYSANFAVDGEIEETWGSITFSDGFVFEPLDGFDGNFTLTECLTQTIPHSKELIPKDNNAISLIPEISIMAVPNPARQEVFMITPSILKIEKTNCFLVDAVGNKIQLSPGSYHFKKEGINLKIEHLPVGIYGFVIQNEDKVLKTRFVKIN